jgi:hypothetical protein
MKSFSDFRPSKGIQEARRSLRPDVVLRDPKILMGTINYLKKKKSLPFSDVILTPKGKEKIEVEELPVRNWREASKDLQDAYNVMWPPYRGAKGNMSIARKVLNGIRFVTPKGRKSVYDVDSKALGTSKDGSGAIPIKGGQSSADNQSNQGFQCVMSACISNKIPPILPNANKIKKLVQLGTSVNVETVLRGADMSWINSAEITHAGVVKGTKNYILSLKGYIWMEEDAPEAKKLKQFAGQIAKKTGETFFTGDRWSAADIWVKRAGFNLNTLYNGVTSLAEYNERVGQAFVNGDLIGVSLKKVGTGTPKVTAKNVPDKDFELKKWNIKPEYVGKDPYIANIQGQIIWQSSSHSGAVLSMISHGGAEFVDYNIALNEGSGGKRDGRVRGGSVVKLCKDLGFNLPDPKTLSRRFVEGYIEGLITEDFLKEFKKVHDASGIFKSASLADLRKHLEGSEYNPAIMNKAEIEKVHATWVNCNFLTEFNKLNDKKKRSVIDNLYQIIAAVGSASSAHLVVGSDSSSKEPISKSDYYDVIRGSVKRADSSPAKKVDIKAEEMAFARQLVKATKQAIGPDGLRVIRKLMQIADREDYNMDKLSKYSSKKLLDIYSTALELDKMGRNIDMAYMEYEDDLLEQKMTRFISF